MAENTVRTTSGGSEAARWYTPTLWHTMSARAWWRLLGAHGFRVRLSRLPIALSVTLTTANNSLLGFLQLAIYGSRLRKTKFAQNPIFVLGHWRSGTTLLHELLALDDRFAFPTSFECFAPQHCLLTDRLPNILWALQFGREELGRNGDDKAVGRVGSPTRRHGPKGWSRLCDGAAVGAGLARRVKRSKA
jgi:hypothetical protein